MTTQPAPPDPPQPTGLLALILLPLQAVLSIGLRLFAALVSNLLGGEKQTAEPPPKVTGEE